MPDFRSRVPKRAVSTTLGLATVAGAVAGFGASPSPVAAAPVVPAEQSRACVYGIMPVALFAYTPYSSSPIRDRSRLKFGGTNVWPCQSYALETLAQTKVCGVWGCNYQNRGQEGKGINASTTYGLATQPCRAGTNRYRTYANYYYFVIGPDMQQEITSVSHDSTTIEFYCNASGGGK